MQHQRIFKHLLCSLLTIILLLSSVTSPAYAIETLDIFYDGAEQGSIDPIKGMISPTHGILVLSHWSCSKWVHDKNGLWLEYLDGSYPHGYITADGQHIFHWEMINGEWYAFDANGYVHAGWIKDAGYNGWFYIDINSGMKTGWQVINGKWYYLNPNSTGVKGMMLADCYTPDGYYVGTDGAWDWLAPVK